MSNKRYFDLFVKSKPRTVKDRFIFIFDNEDMATALIAASYRALALDSAYNLDNLIGDIAENNIPLGVNNIVVVPCLSKTDNGRITEALKGVCGYENDGYKIFHKREYLKQPEYSGELTAALAEYIERHAGQAEEEILSPEALEEIKKEYEDENNAAYLQSLFDRIADSKNDRAIQTGFNALDEELKGGLYAERLYAIAAATSLGKTTFVQNICDNMAQAGTDILYFSLEMSRYELMAKSISRHTYEISLETAMGSRWARTALDIMAGEKYEVYSKGERGVIEDATEAYREYSNHIYTFEGVGNIGVKDIREAVEKHIRLTGRKPVVIIDYLQILAPKSERASDKQNADYNILELKRLARDARIPVICISSINRTNYLVPIDLEAIKESGNIEFTCDTIIGLQFDILNDEAFDRETNIKKKRELINDARAETPRKIDAVLLKNRQGETGNKVLFDYYSAYNCFVEAGKAAPKKQRIQV